MHPREAAHVPVTRRKLAVSTGVGQLEKHIPVAAKSRDWFEALTARLKPHPFKTDSRCSSEIRPTDPLLFLPEAAASPALWTARPSQFFASFMKSESASREGCTSPPIPKNRQKLIIKGCHLHGSIWGRAPSPTNNDSSMCNLKMCTSKAFADTFFPNGRTSCTIPSICTGHSAIRGGRTMSDDIGVSPATPNLSAS